MQIQLRRFHQDIICTLGMLTAPGMLLSDGAHLKLTTIELPEFYNKINVSRIPAGTYPIELIPVGQKLRIRLGVVSGRTLINMEVANKAAQLQGCIGLGEGVTVKNGVWSTIRSRPAFNSLLALLQEDPLERWEINIMDCFPSA